MAEPSFQEVTELATKLARFFDPKGDTHETVDRNYARAVLVLGYKLDDDMEAHDA